MQGDAAGAVAVRAVTAMTSRRRVTPLALAQARPTRDPAARSRLCAMAAQASQAAFAGERPEGRWARGPGVQVPEQLLGLGMAAVVFLGLQGRGP